MRQKFPLRTTPAVNLRFNIEGLTNGPDVVGGLFVGEKVMISTSVTVAFINIITFSLANRCLDGG